MIEIEKDINVFGFEIFKGSIVSIVSWNSNIKSSIIQVTVSDGDKSINFPIIPKTFNKTFDAVLSEIVKQNTNHDSYYEYLKDITK